MNNASRTGTNRGCQRSLETEGSEVRWRDLSRLSGIGGKGEARFIASTALAFSRGIRRFQDVGLGQFSSAIEGEDGRYLLNAGNILGIFPYRLDALFKLS